MTRLSSPSSRSSLETSSALDLASGLTARLKTASFQPLAPDCAVLPNSTVLGVGVPSLLPSLAEEGLVSSLITDRVSSGLSGGLDKVQLDQPGKSNMEETLISREKVGDSGKGSKLVLGSGLLEELIQTKVAPSVLSLSGSESFSPSAFMSGDTRGGLSTFGGGN